MSAVSLVSSAPVTTLPGFEMLAQTSPFLAQKPGASPLLTKGVVVTLKLPSVVVTANRVGVGSPITGSKLICVVDLVESLPGVFVPNRVSDWRVAGFPWLNDFNFEKVGTVNGATEVEYRNSLINLKFRMGKGVDPATALKDFLILGSRGASEVAAYREEATRRIADHVFQEELATILPDHRIALLALASEAAGTIGLRTVSREVYKEHAYLSVDLNGDGLMYNTLQLSESQRVARVMNERLFGILKAFGKALTGTGLYGIKLRVAIQHADFLNKLGTLAYDNVDLYAPSDLIAKFSDADITNQDFIDGCIVIVDGNRVKVVLGLGSSCLSRCFSRPQDVAIKARRS